MSDSEWRTLIEQGIVPSVLGALGRLLSLAMEEGAGPRGWRLWRELVFAISLGLLGKALADYFGYTGTVSYAIIIMASFLGPRKLNKYIIAIEKKFFSSKIT